jgi:hypothetical protein
VNVINEVTAEFPIPHNNQHIEGVGGYNKNSPNAAIRRLTAEFTASRKEHTECIH